MFRHGFECLWRRSERHHRAYYRVPLCHYWNSRKNRRPRTQVCYFLLFAIVVRTALFALNVSERNVDLLLIIFQIRKKSFQMLGMWWTLCKISDRPNVVIICKFWCLHICIFTNSVCFYLYYIKRLFFSCREVVEKIVKEEETPAPAQNTANSSEEAGSSSGSGDENKENKGETTAANSEEQLEDGCTPCDRCKRNPNRKCKECNCYVS